MLTLCLTRSDQSALVVLGLSLSDLASLRTGHPIFRALRELGLGEGTMAVLLGSTEDAIRAELRTSGFAVPEAPKEEAGSEEQDA
jgi:hypothetical protein